MKIIPVIDIFNNQVVHAIRGQRNQYQPVKSILTANNAPLAFVAAFLELFPFDTLYIADLNAIQSMGNNQICIDEIVSEFPGLKLWVDNSATRLSSINTSHERGLIPVISTESNISAKTIKILNDTNIFYILSLDFFNDNLLGNKLIIQDPDIWPENIILMDLDRVGSDLGPDINYINKFMHLNLNCNYYIAGGVRHEQDIQSLDMFNISGCLIASALHNGNIDSKVLNQLTKHN